MGMDMERLSKENRLAIIAMRKKGFDKSEISFALNIPESVVYRCIQYHFGTKRKNRERLDYDTRDKIWELYQKGLKPWLIAERTNVDPDQVYSLVNYRKRKIMMFEKCCG
jgi:hypothetical protein